MKSRYTAAVYLCFHLVVVADAPCVAADVAEFRRCVVFLESTGSPHGDGQGKQQVAARFTATGFILRHPSGLFLVSAKHVVATTKNRTKVAFRAGDGKSKFVFLESLNERGVDAWIANPDADVAVFLIVPTPRNKQYVDQLTALAVDSSAIDVAAPRLTTEVIAYGFPISLGTYGKISPLTVPVRVVSEEIHVPTAEGLKPCILLSPPVGLGMSGAPVCTFDGMKSLLVGIVKGDHVDTSGGKYTVLVPSHNLVATLKMATIEPPREEPPE